MRSIKFNRVKPPLYTLGVVSLAAVTVGAFAMLSMSKEATVWREQVKLLPPDAGNDDDYFGKAVAIDGDTVVVGSIYHKPGGQGTGSGAAYIYKHSGAKWSLQAKLLPNNIQDRISFGYSAAIDGSTTIVGAAYSGRTGAAYIFTRTGATWSRQVQLWELLPPSDKQTSRFGYTVDVDRDTAVVASTVGAYVFTRNPVTNSWSYHSKLEVQGGTTPHGPSYGFDAKQLIAISGDTIIYGNYVFNRNPQTGSWNQQTRLEVPCAAVAIDGDTVVIGAPDVNNGDGVAYVFARNPQTGMWSQQARLGRGWELPKLFINYHFGSSVAIDGNTIVVGSYSPNGPFGREDSAAHVFARSHPRAPWLRQAKLVSQDYERSSELGRSVGVSSNQVVVGAPREYDDIRNLRSGAAYVFTPVEANAARK